jgi:ketosteroid isomerase-like protein
MTLTLEQSQALIADRLELSDLLARLSRAVDRADHAAIVDCYAEDSYDEHGSGYQGSGRGFADYICGGSPTSGAARFLLHLLGQSLFDIDGDEAFGETAYMMDLQTEAGELIHASGRYLDYFQRIDGSWKVKYRRVVSEWTGPVSNGDGYPKAPGQLTSARDKSDPVYHPKRWPDKL